MLFTGRSTFLLFYHEKLSSYSSKLSCGHQFEISVTGYKLVQTDSVRVEQTGVAGSDGWWEPRQPQV